MFYTFNAPFWISDHHTPFIRHYCNMSNAHWNPTYDFVATMLRLLRQLNIPPMCYNNFFYLTFKKKKYKLENGGRVKG